MAYVKKTWVNGEILDADKMNHLEQGVYDNSVDLSEKANVDGSYPDLSAGLADNLDTTVGANDSVPYNFRTSGGSIDTSNKERVDAIVGGTVAWNQLCNGSSTTVPNGHKYIAYIGGTWSVGTSNGTALTTDASTDKVFDITQMYGSTIANYVSSLTSAQEIAWFYGLYPNAKNAVYNAGELMSVKTSAHKMVGFNQWDEEWENGIYGNGNLATAKQENAAYICCKNPIRVLPNTVYYFKVPNYYSNYARMRFYDADGNNIGYIGTSSNRNATFTTPENCYWMVFWTGELVGSGVTYNHDICINIHWDGERDGEYEPYEAHTYALDDVELRGIPKLDANNKLYYDGDTYEPDGTVTRKYGIVDLSTLDWSDSTSTRYISKSVSGMKPCPNSSETPNIVAEKYRTIQWRYGLSENPDAITVSNDSNAKLYLCKDANTSTPSGYLVYELATSTTESADAYQQTQNVSDWGTEEYVDSRTVPIPVGHNTFYPENLKRKLQNLPSDFSTLIARTESGFTATKAYTANEFLIIKNQLYKTTASIANGATITPNTNVVATTIGEVLTAILNS